MIPQYNLEQKVLFRVFNLYFWQNVIKELASIHIRVKIISMALFCLLRAYKTKRATIQLINSTANYKLTVPVQKRDYRVT